MALELALKENEGAAARTYFECFHSNNERIYGPILEI